MTRDIGWADLASPQIKGFDEGPGLDLNSFPERNGLLLRSFPYALCTLCRKSGPVSSRQGQVKPVSLKGLGESQSGRL